MVLLKAKKESFKFMEWGQSPSQAKCSQEQRCCVVKSSDFIKKKAKIQIMYNSSILKSRLIAKIVRTPPIGWK